jgi:hypothetical protein
METNYKFYLIYIPSTMTTLSEGASAITTPFHSAFGIVDNRVREER